MTRIDQLLSAAQSGDRESIREVLAEAHPGVHRIAHALAGEEERAAQVVDAVYRNALRSLPQWSSWGDPETWFFHQTVQAARRICQGRPASDEDLLYTAISIEQRTPAYLAFVRGIRRLPQQQIEAFILHHGDRQNERLIGVAMDCSTQAAQTHLKAADAAMQPLAGNDWAVLTAMLNQACRRMSPSLGETDRVVQRYLGAWSGKRTRRRLGKLILILVVAVALLLLWPLRGMLHDSPPPPMPASQPAK
jgi:DNA-directed RNA polymerase specialized sigma24 family protein